MRNDIRSSRSRRCREAATGSDRRSLPQNTCYRTHQYNSLFIIYLLPYKRIHFVYDVFQLVVGVRWRQLEFQDESIDLGGDYLLVGVTILFAHLVDAKRNRQSLLNSVFDQPLRV